MEATSLKDVMEKLACDIKQVRDSLKQQANTFDLSEFLQLLNSEGKVSLSDFISSVDPTDSSSVPTSVPQGVFSTTSIPISNEIPKRQDLSHLVSELVKNEKEASVINEQIQKLSSKDKKLFWAMYHGIPLDETSMKLDTVISSLTTLNANIVNNFNYKERLEDILDEIEILRQEIRSKPTAEENQ